MKVGIVLGTRPEIIKLAPIIFELDRLKIKYFTIHTGQHYSENMDRIFWDTLEIPQPHYLLGVREPSHARQTSEMLRKIDEILELEQPDWVIVQGDTNSTMAGALAASKRKNVRLAHLEAGLRSFDRSMPEEVNRVIVDHISNLLLAPTEESMKYLSNEGISSEICFNVGNTVEDMLLRSLPLAHEKSHIIESDKVFSTKYCLLTLHRQENTEDPTRLFSILNSIFSISADYRLNIVFPIHPRTKGILSQSNFRIPEHVRLIDPVGYFDFIVLQQNAQIITTDSGGIQEESCILGVPCVTLRENTERPETIRLGSNILAGVSPDRIMSAMAQQISSKGVNTWMSPYGNGKAAQRVVNIINGN